jgi:penicillin-binding protein 1A
MFAIPFTKRFRQLHPRLTRTLLLAGAFFVSFGLGIGYASWATVCNGGRCPPVSLLDEYTPRQTSKLYAADGKFLAELGLERRTLLKIDQIPAVVRNAFIIVEDKRFYRHAGIDWIRVPGALLHDIKARSFEEGFSTITMQLARNIFPERISRDKSPIRKLKEAKVARAIEAKYSKDRILELYLNQIYLGNGAYGIETAAQRYFGKSTRDLNVAEAATLAALPKGPERYNPRRSPERTTQRRNTVIALMRGAGVINEPDARLAAAYPLKLANRTETGEAAPYFVEYVRQLLDEKFGQQLYEQGLKVYTTLDVELQSAAERAMERQLRAIENGRFGAYRHVSYERYMARAGNRDNDNASGNAPYLQGAFVAMDPRNGAVRALIGGRDFDDNKFNRAVQAIRQPGSTFKPIVFADAVQNGRPMTYLLEDTPLSLETAPGQTWTPQNYSGVYSGRTTLRFALSRSLNLPTIRLGMELGAPSVIEMARRFGITTPIPPYPSIYLGAADVIPLEIIASYSTFATLGTRAAPQAIVRVEDNKGTVLWEPEPVRYPVLSSEEAWLMVSALKDVILRGSAAGSVGSTFHYPAGGKTGTTNDGTDVWFIGFTTDLVAGIWMGFDKPQKIKSNAQGGVLAAPAWVSFMTEAYRRQPAPPDWPTPPSIIARHVDASTNLLANAYCPRIFVVTDYYIPGTEPMRECDVHTAYTVYPDTSGGTVVPPGVTPPTILPPRDSMRRPTDTTIFRLDSARARAVRDSIRRRDSIRAAPGRPFSPHGSEPPTRSTTPPR